MTMTGKTRYNESNGHLPYAPVLLIQSKMKDFGIIHLTKLHFHSDPLFPLRVTRMVLINCISYAVNCIVILLIRIGFLRKKKMCEPKTSCSTHIMKIQMQLYIGINLHCVVCSLNFAISHAKIHNWSKAMNMWLSFCSLALYRLLQRLRVNWPTTITVSGNRTEEIRGSFCRFYSQYISFKLVLWEGR